MDLNHELEAAQEVEADAPRQSLANGRTELVVIESEGRGTRHFGQQCVRLRPRAARRLKAMLDEAVQFAIDNGDPNAGLVCLVTTVMTPLRDRS